MFPVINKIKTININTEIIPKYTRLSCFRTDYVQTDCNMDFTPIIPISNITHPLQMKMASKMLICLILKILNTYFTNMNPMFYYILHFCRTFTSLSSQQFPEKYLNIYIYLFSQGAKANAATPLYQR